MSSKFSPFPFLSTKRLLLRNLFLNDSNEIFLLRSDNEVNKYIDRPRSLSIDDAIDFINKTNLGIENDQWVYWAITYKEFPALIGTICLWNISKEESKAEIGYDLLPEFQKKGFAKEAVSVVLDYGFDIIKLNKIEAFTHKENFSSIKLLEKFNFKRDLDTESKIDRTIDPNNIVYSLSKNN